MDRSKKGMKKPSSRLPNSVQAFRSPDESESTSGVSMRLAILCSDKFLPGFQKAILVFIVFEDGIPTISTIHAACSSKVRGGR
jgi:hypothetical protein